MITLPPCRCCGSHDTRVLGSKRGQFIARKFDYLKCQSCDFIFVEPVTGFEIYDDAYYRGEGADPLVDYEAEYHDYTRTGRQHEFRDIVRIVQALLHESDAGSPVRWLDFGCGAGGFLKFLQRQRTLQTAHGTRPILPTGCDVGSYAQRLRNDGFAIVDQFELEQAVPGSYEIISMIEVLEHMPRPREPLAMASRLLKPGGILVLTTGNLASPAAQAAGLDFSYCRPEIHVSLFSPQSLQRLYGQVGMQPLFVKYGGVIEFKVLKSMSFSRLRPLVACALRLPGIRAWIDRRYGVSAMPWATKPY